MADELADTLPTSKEASEGASIILFEDKDDGDVELHLSNGINLIFVDAKLVVVHPDPDTN